MADYTLRPRARRDLEETWSYSADRWSPEQADAYLRSLDAVFRQLVDHPLRGRAIDEIRAGYRTIQAGSHLIVYRPAEKQIEIVRVLHQSMDPDRDL